MAGDLYWGNVVLAMHMDDTGLTDVKGHAVTLNGNAARSSTQSQFGGYSAYFDGSGDYLTIPASSDFDFGSGDFTVEAWIRLDSLTGSQCVFSIGKYNSDGGIFYIDSSGKMGFYRNATSVLLGSGSVSALTWTHVAWVRSGSTLTAYMNGVSQGSTTFTGLLVDSSGIGCFVSQGYATVGFSNEYMTGYIDDLRITKGVGRYTANFTPPTAAFPDTLPTLSGVVKDASNNLTSRVVRAFRRDTGALIGTALSDATTGTYSIPTSYGGEHFVLAHDTNDADPYWDKVVLACHFDGVPDNGDPYRNNVVLNIRGNDGLDDTGKTLTYNGNATVSTAQKKYGSASLYFDGSGDYISLADSSDWTFGSGEFTVEFWMKSPGNGTYDQLLGQRDSAGGANVPFGISRNNTANTLLPSYRNAGGTLTSSAGTAVVFNDAWHHIAFVRQGDNLKLYVDGTLDVTMALTAGYALYDSADTFSIGRAGAYNGQYYLGYIDDLRITKGVARYTANFTPPTAEIPAISGTRFKDSSSTAKTLTPNGDVVISSTQSKFGGYSAYFDGSGDYISVPDSNDWLFGSGDLTVECWVNLGAAGAVAGRTIVGQHAGTIADSSIVFYMLVSGGAYTGIACRFTDGTTEAYPSASFSFSTSQWYHVAVTRASGVVRFFVDGTKIGSDISNSYNLPNSTAALNIGRWQGQSLDFNGYIDDLRITKGVARYTANFTPPTQAFRESPNGGTENAVILDRIVPV